MQTTDSRVLTVHRGQDTATVKLTKDGGKPRTALVVPYGVVPELAAGILQRKVGDHEVAAVDDGRPVSVRWGVGEPVTLAVAGRKVLTVESGVAQDLAMALHHAAGADPNATGVSAGDGDVSDVAPASGGGPVEPTDTVDRGAGHASSPGLPTVEELLTSDEHERAPDPLVSPIVPTVRYSERKVAHSTADISTYDGGGVELTDELENECAMRPYRQVRSWSQLTKFEECAYCYRLSVVERRPERPAWWFVGGRALHAVIERYEIARYAGRVQSREWAVGAFGRYFHEEIQREQAEQAAKLDSGWSAWPDKDDWRAAARGKEDEAWWWTAGIDMAQLYVDNRANGEDQFELLIVDGKPALETRVVGSFGGVDFAGYVDRVANVDGKLWVDDYKSGTKPPNDPGQGIAYAHALQDMYPDVVVAGARYYMARGGNYLTYSIDEIPRRTLDIRFSAFDRAEYLGLYSPNLSGFGHRCRFYEEEM
jgi:hypothetical protein